MGSQKGGVLHPFCSLRGIVSLGSTLHTSENSPFTCGCSIDFGLMIFHRLASFQLWSTNRTASGHCLYPH
jgi:hypothetical protein